MPVRSLSSSVLKWPDRETVRRAALEWALSEAARRPELLNLGYFGSYARGDWGVGSDLDLVAITSASSRPFDERSRDWRLEHLPVPAEILVYTATEWERLASEDNRFFLRLAQEVVWLIGDTPNITTFAERDRQ